LVLVNQIMPRALFLSLSLLATPALAQGVVCPTAAGHIAPQTICTALLGALGGRTAPGLRLEILANDPQKLAARLVWATAAGPVIEVFATSTALDDRAAGRLAQGLVKSTDIP
jgi:hypothetical protein